MDFERFKAAWQRKEFEGCVVGGPKRQTASEIRKTIQGIDRKAFWRSITETLSGILSVAILAGWLRSEQSALVRAGAIVLMAGAVFILFALSTVRIRYRASGRDLPLKELFHKERERVNARIRLQRWSSWLCLVPVALGLGLYLFSMNPSTAETILLPSALIALAMTFDWFGRRKVQKQLLPRREELERHLRNLTGNPY